MAYGHLYRHSLDWPTSSLDYALGWAFGPSVVRTQWAEGPLCPNLGGRRPPLKKNILKYGPMEGHSRPSIGLMTDGLWPS